MIRFRLVPALRSVVLVAFLAAGGCSTVKQREPASQPVAGASNTVRLVYRTESGRLNALAVAAQPPIQYVGYSPPRANPVPDFTLATLEIKHPHPAGGEDWALVTVVFESSGDRAAAADLSSVWNKIAGLPSDAQPDGVNGKRFREVWTTDIPRWQLEGVIAKLRQENFYKRVKVFDAHALVATEIAGDRFAKDFKEIPELDTLILRIRGQGQLVGRTGPAAGTAPPSFRAPPLFESPADDRITRLPDIGDR